MASRSRRRGPAPRAAEPRERAGGPPRPREPARARASRSPGPTRCAWGSWSTRAGAGERSRPAGASPEPARARAAAPAGSPARAWRCGARRRGRRGPGRRGHDDRRRGRHGHRRGAWARRPWGRRRRALRRPSGAGALVTRSAWRGRLRGALDLRCGAHRTPRALVHEQLDAPGEASPVVELVGDLDLAAGPDVLEPAVLGADGDPRGLGHHQRYHAAPERSGVDVDGVGFDLRHPAHRLAVGPVPPRRERVVARIGRPEHQHDRGQERQAPGRGADREKAVAAGYHASTRQEVP